MSLFRNLLLGGLFGYILGLLFAPKRGADLREEIKDLLWELEGRTEEAYSNASSRSHELMEKAQPTIEKVKEEAKNLKSKASSSFNEAVARTSAQ